MAFWKKQPRPRTSTAPAKPREASVEQSTGENIFSAAVSRVKGFARLASRRSPARAAHAKPAPATRPKPAPATRTANPAPARAAQPAAPVRSVKPQASAPKPIRPAAKVVPLAKPAAAAAPKPTPKVEPDHLLMDAQARAEAFSQGAPAIKPDAADSALEADAKRRANAHLQHPEVAELMQSSNATELEQDAIRRHKNAQRATPPTTSEVIRRAVADWNAYARPLPQSLQGVVQLVADRQGTTPDDIETNNPLLADAMNRAAAQKG